MRDPLKIKQRTDWLKLQYGARNDQYRMNRLAYEGKFDEIMALQRNLAVTGLDSRNRRDSSMQVWNLMKPVVDFTMIQMARMPALIVPPAKSGDEALKEKSSLEEKFLYWNWDQSFMEMRHMEIGFSTGCYGSAAHQLVPDFERKLIIFKERDPIQCYPMPSGDGQTYEWVSFSWSEDAEALVMRYPHLEGFLPSKGGRMYRTVDVIEYQDKEDYGFVIGDKWAPGMPGYTHNLGYIPVTITPTVKMPGSNNPFGPCDIDQLIAINILMNALQTKVYDALEENLYPATFVMGNTEIPIDSSPGAVNFLGPKESSDVKRLDPPQIPSQVWTQIASFEDFIRTHANWSEVWSGQLGQSQASGSAIRRLQGPANGMAGIRQMLLAADLRKMNTYWLSMYEHFFGDTKYNCVDSGLRGTTSAPGRPVGFSVEIVPDSDIAGYHTNMVEYSIFGADLNSTLVAVQQLTAGELASKEWAMSQIPGIVDEQGMRDQIEAEQMRKIEKEAELQARLEEIKTQNFIKQQEAMAQAQSQIEAAKAGGGAAPPGMASPTQQTPGVPGNVTLLPQGQPQVIGVGEPLTGQANFPLDYLNAKPFGQALGAMNGGGQMAPGGPPPGQTPRQPALPAGGPAPKEANDPNVVTAEQVVADIKGIAQRIAGGEIRSRSGGLKGDVYLLGEIAKRGRTMGNIEVGVTESSDGQLILNALPQYRGRLTIKPLEGVPAQGVLVMKGGADVSGETEAA